MSTSLNKNIKLLAIAISVFIIIVCIAIIYGWFADIQIHRLYAPMQFNTVLIFLFLSLILILQTKRKSKYVLLLSCLTFFFSAIILSQYIFDIDLRVDNIFNNPFITVKSSHPGRPSPTTLICFLLITFSLILFNLLSKKLRVLSAIFIVSCTTAISLLSVMSFVDSRFYFEWHSLTKMTFHTSVCMLILSLLLTFIYTIQNDYKPFKKLVISFSLFTFLSTIALIFWVSFTVQEQANIIQKQKMKILYFIEELEESIVTNYYSLVKLGSKLQESNYKYKKDLQDYLSKNNSVDFIGIVNRDNKWTHIENNNESLNGVLFNKLFTNKTIDKIIGNFSDQDIMMALVVINKNSFLAIGYPLYDNGIFNGYLVGVYDFKSLTTKPSINISIFYNGDLALGSTLNEKDNILVKGNILNNEIKALSNKNLTIRSGSGLLPEFAGIGGLILALFTSVALYQYQTAKEKSELNKENLTFTTAILDSMDDGVITILNEGEELAFNPKTLELFQTTESEFLSWFSIENLLAIYSSSKHPIQSALNQTIRVTRATEVFHRPNGSSFIAEYTIRNILSSEQVATVIVFADISERLETERRLQESLIELTDRNIEVENARIHAETANRAKSQFLANISHELRTPLNGIIGLGELLDNTELDEKQKKYIEMHRHSSDALFTLINDTLDLSKIESGNMSLENREFNLKSLLININNKYSAHAKEKNIDFILDFPKDENYQFVGDSFRINQVLNNLISNGIKFTKKGTVTCKVSIQKKDIDNSLICFKISDTGIGIAEKDLPTLFNLFTQIDVSYSRKFGGVGLGLTIVKKLSELLNGNIKVYSELGKGSTFIFTVPLKGVKK